MFINMNLRPFWWYAKGFFVGATSAGFVGDRFGRKVGLILFHLLTAVCLVLNGWLSIWNYYAYCILQMFTVRWGFEHTRVHYSVVTSLYDDLGGAKTFLRAVHAACLMHFVYSMEIIGPKVSFKTLLTHLYKVFSTVQQLEYFLSPSFRLVLWFWAP